MGSIADLGPSTWTTGETDNVDQMVNKVFGEILDIEIRDFSKMTNEERRIYVDKFIRDFKIKTILK